MSGLTPQGFLTKRLIEIKEEIESNLTETFGNVDLRPQSVFGQLVGLESERLAQLWDLAEAVYLSQYPDFATGMSLDHVASIIGILRRPATPTQVTAMVRGLVNTEMSAGLQAFSPEINDFYEVVSLTVLEFLNAFQFLITPTVIDEVTYSLSINSVTYSYTALPDDGEDEILQGLIDSLTGDSIPVVREDESIFIDLGTTANLFIISNLAVTEIGMPVLFRNTEVGARFLPTNTLTEIETPIAGWQSVNNPFEAVLGINAETDTELRRRREESITITATNTVDSILSKMRQVPLVQDVVVRANNSEATDSFGTPRQHIWTIVEGGADFDIATVLYDTVAAGIGYRGEEEFGITSPVSGNETTILFDRPSYIDVDISVEFIRLDDFPEDGEAELLQALVDRGIAFRINENLIFSQLYTPINSVSGIQVQSLTVNGSTANIVTDPNEKIRILEGDVTLTDVTP